MAPIAASAIRFFERLLIVTACAFLMCAPFGKLAVRICFWLMGCSWVMINLIKHGRRFYRGMFIPFNFFPAILFFIAALVFSVALSSNFYLSQRIFFDRYLIFLLFFFIGAWICARSKKYLAVLVAALMATGLVFGSGGLRDYLFYSYANPDLAKRLWSIYGIRILYYGLPLYLTLFIPFNFFMLLLGKGKPVKILAFINVLSLSMCMLWTSSRIAWAAVLLTAASSVLLIKTRKRKLVILIFFLLIIAGALAFPRVRERIKTIPVPHEWSNRIPLYKAAYAIFKDYPVAGAGIGTFEKLLHTPKYELPDNYPVAKELNLHAHNTYLEIAAETGIIGLLAFLLLFIAFFSRVIKRIQEATLSQTDTAILGGLSASVLSMLIFALGSTIITVGPTVSSYFWFIFGLASGFLSKREAAVEAEFKK